MPTTKVLQRLSQHKHREKKNNEKVVRMEYRHEWLLHAFFRVGGPSKYSSSRSLLSSWVLALYTCDDPWCILVFDLVLTCSSACSDLKHMWHHWHTGRHKQYHHSTCSTLQAPLILVWVRCFSFCLVLHTHLPLMPITHHRLYWFPHSMLWIFNWRLIKSN